MLNIVIGILSVGDSSENWLDPLNIANQIHLIMKIVSSGTLFWGIVLLLMPSIVSAELHGTFTMTTNNVGRWFTKSENKPALLANLDYQHDSGLYLGSSVSNIEYRFEGETNESHVEVIPYLGWSFKLSEQWRLDTQWSRYLFDGNVFGHIADYNEFYLFFHYKDLFTGRFSVSDDFYGLGDIAMDYELTAKYPLIDRLEFSASFGYSQTTPAVGSDYPYWNAGLTYYYKFISFDLRYMDATETNIDPVRSEKLHEKYDPTLMKASAVFSVSLGF